MNGQPDLFETARERTQGDRDGATYERKADLVRLNRQGQVVWDIMVGGRWLTLSEIAEASGEPEASISARIRDFRKERFGGHTVDRRRRGGDTSGLFEYRLTAVKGGPR